MTRTSHPTALSHSAWDRHTLLSSCDGRASCVTAGGQAGGHLLFLFALALDGGVGEAALDGLLVLHLLALALGDRRRGVDAALDVLLTVGAAALHRGAGRGQRDGRGGPGHHPLGVRGGLALIPVRTDR